MQSVPIDALAEVQTSDATPQNTVLFEANPNSSINARVLICCRRPSDGATKAWDLTAAMAMGPAGGNVVNKATRDAAAFGLAADLTALSAASIAFYASGPNIGLTITGIAATDLEWGVMLRGIQVLD